MFVVNEEAIAHCGAVAPETNKQNIAAAYESCVVATDTIRGFY
jgi:hypothetical protein